MDIPAGNLVAAAGILLSCGSYSKFLYFCFGDAIKLQFISESHFYRVQVAYLLPVLNEPGNTIRTLIKRFKGTPLCLLGYGRCFASLGYSAKYGMYTHLEQDIGLVLNFQVVLVAKLPTL